MTFYINYLHFEFYNVLKYADDTSFYKTATTSQLATVVPAIRSTLEWSKHTHTSLNTCKNEIINILINYRNKYDDDVLVDLYQTKWMYKVFWSFFR